MLDLQQASSRIANNFTKIKNYHGDLTTGSALWSHDSEWKGIT